MPGLPNKQVRSIFRRNCLDPMRPAAVSGPIFADLHGQLSASQKTWFGGPTTSKWRHFNWATWSKTPNFEYQDPAFHQFGKASLSADRRIQFFLLVNGQDFGDFPRLRVRNSQENTVQREPWRSQNLMVWGGFSMNYRTSLVFVDCSLTANGYITQIPETEVVQFCRSKSDVRFFNQLTPEPMWPAKL